MVSNVFDLIYPSPATLQEISSGALVSALWHWEVKNRVNDDFEEFLSELDLCQSLPLKMPSPIKRMIQEYSQRFVSSIKQWLFGHYKRLFHFHRNNKFHILHDFYDFTCNRFGNIHFLRTARRMMICDRLSNEEKFKIACMYCFEDDIRRIWPLVSERLRFNVTNYSHLEENPELFYWISKLRNEPDQMPDNGNDTLADVIVGSYISPSLHWSSVLYFWNRASPENRLARAIDLSQDIKEIFVRFILHTLSDQELDEFAAEKASSLMYALLTNSFDKFCVLPTWMYIKNKMNESNFPRLIGALIKYETNYYDNTLVDEEDPFRLDDWSSTGDNTYLCCEVWRSTPDELKRSAIKYILTRDQLFIRKHIRPTLFKETRFLLTVLSDASFEDRNALWHKYWRHMMTDMRVTDLHRIMKLCFRDENDITRFKETSMAEHENIGEYCNMLMKLGYFKELNDILMFCCPDTNKRKVIKQFVTYSCFFDEPMVINEGHLTEVELMNEFINDASDDAETAASFKNGFASFSRVEKILRQCIISEFNCASSDHLIHFIETLVHTEDATVALKQEILNYVRGFLMNGNVTGASVYDLQTILLWCLGNEDQVTNFKQSLSISHVFRLVRSEANLFELKTDPNFDEFLKWYFRTSEKIEEFERQFSDQSKI
ncbi:uncharacterized protein LOC135834500 isoform X14 [Planococcus citri]|uniref:uncharacterized protein LOC135834500 isoform X14 n=1 Tax=Planococcus citri TaxID=170843 RepID=UPI0031F7A11D